MTSTLMTQTDAQNILMKLEDDATTDSVTRDALRAQRIGMDEMSTQISVAITVLEEQITATAKTQHSMIEDLTWASSDKLEGWIEGTE
jgi:hypothetical protein